MEIATRVGRVERSFQARPRTHGLMHQHQRLQTSTTILIQRHEISSCHSRMTTKRPSLARIHKLPSRCPYSAGTVRPSPARTAGGAKSAAALLSQEYHAQIAPKTERHAPYRRAVMSCKADTGDQQYAIRADQRCHRHSGLRVRYRRPHALLTLLDLLGESPVTATLKLLEVTTR